MRRVLTVGMKVGHCTVRDIMNDRGRPTTRLDCSCGTRFVVRSYTALEQSTNPDYRCKICRPPIRGKQVAPKTCSFCHETGHNLRNCKTKPARKNESCEVCEGLPWRRPAGKCECGGTRAFERGITTRDILNAPYENRRVLVG